MTTYTKSRTNMKKRSIDKQIYKSIIKTNLTRITECEFLFHKLTDAIPDKSSATAL